MGVVHCGAFGGAFGGALWCTFLLSSCFYLGSCGAPKSAPLGGRGWCMWCTLYSKNASHPGSCQALRLKAMGIRDRPISPGSPWQNGIAERLLGMLRHECLDQVFVFDEAHLRRVFDVYAAYYNQWFTSRLIRASRQYGKNLARVPGKFSRAVLTSCASGSPSSPSHWLSLKSTSVPMRGCPATTSLAMRSARLIGLTLCRPRMTCAAIYRPWCVPIARIQETRQRLTHSSTRS